MTRLPAAALFAALLLAGSPPACQSIPGKGFDPRAVKSGAVSEGKFEQVSRSQKLDSSLLRPPAEPYRLGPGDLLEIEVAQVPNTLSRTFVMPDGMVYYDLAGGVKAEGLTTGDLGKALRASLKHDYTDPLVNVSLVEVRSRRYWMLGRVFKPGIFPLRQPTTLLEAISQSGGLFTSSFSGTTEELADLSSSVVIRDGKILPVDFQRLIKHGDTSQNIYLRHNDLVYLPSSQGGSVLLLGAVNEPKSVSFKDSLSLVQCLAYGRGPAEGAYMQKVVIVRGSRSKPEATTVNLQDIITGKATDVALKPGDIVWVPRSPFVDLSQGVELVFQDAARTIAVNEGAAAAGSSQKSVVTIPAGVPTSSGNGN